MKKRLITFLALSSTSLLSVAAITMTFHIHGIPDGPALNNARARLEAQVKNMGKLNKEKVEIIYENGGRDVRTAIKPFGYFKARIKSQFLSHDGKAWRAHYFVTPGPELKITSLHINVIGPGKNDKKILKARRHIKLKIGDVFDTPKYEQAKTALLNKAEDQGYMQAKFEKDKILVNLQQYTCEIDLTFDTGHRYYFGKTTFNKNPLSRRFLARYLPYKLGEPFSSSKLLSLQNNLSAAGYYRGVSVEPQQEKSKNYKIPVQVVVTPHKEKRYQFGLGYGTISGPRITGAINWRWTNHTGNKFKVETNLSRVQQQLSAEYVIPGSKPWLDHYSINAAIFTLRPQHGDSFIRKFGGTYASQVGKWKRNISLSYVLERYRINSGDPYKNSHLLLPNIGVSWLSSNDLLKMKNGAKFTFMLQGAYKGLASSVSFLQARTAFKALMTFWKNNRIIFGTELGYTIVHKDSDLPLSYRFYTGGPNSVRGFASLGIGPGRYLTQATVEYQRRVVGNWYGAVFYDAGNAFNSFNNWASDLQRSAGIGAVWQSPIGNLSFYLAKALTTKGQPIRFEFSLGPAL
jgi:translocation and assembly module TamA